MVLQGVVMATTQSQSTALCKLRERADLQAVFFHCCATGARRERAFPKSPIRLLRATGTSALRPVCKLDATRMQLVGKTRFPLRSGRGGP
jgi:hypothetical protein